MTDIERWKQDPDVQKILRFIRCEPWEPGWHDICEECKVAIGGLEGLCIRIDLLDRAIDILADFPENYSWMSPIEKKAYAFGVVKDSDIIDCSECGGEGYVDPENQGLDYERACQICRGGGNVFTNDAKTRIKAAFPEYNPD